MALATITTPPVGRTVRADGTDWHPIVIGLATATNEALRGQLMATLVVTLVAGDIVSTINDTRIGPFSYIGLMPMTKSAAQVNDQVYIRPMRGYCNIHHPNAPETDMTFMAVIIGGS